MVVTSTRVTEIREFSTLALTVRATVASVEKRLLLDAARRTI